MSIGDLHRYLRFYHVYEVLESHERYAAMVEDGWFPFIETLAADYKRLGDAYSDGHANGEAIQAVVDGFNESRVTEITERWWHCSAFADKKALIEAGVDAYLQDTPHGFVNCIKNLFTEIEGILRKLYLADEGIRDHVKSPELIQHIIQKGRSKAQTDKSLLFAGPFLSYLNDVIFANFSVESGAIDISRNSASHGVADASQYTKVRALQLILVLDQIYWYCS